MTALERLQADLGERVAWVSREDIDNAGPVLLLATVDDAAALVAATDEGATLVELDPTQGAGLRDALTAWLEHTR